jgi:hypothetical protein
MKHFNTCRAYTQLSKRYRVVVVYEVHRDELASTIAEFNSLNFMAPQTVSSSKGKDHLSHIISCRTEENMLRVSYEVNSVNGVEDICRFLL